nr:hypothetical protein [Tanacetum cinerariifolium]
SIKNWNDHCFRVDSTAFPLSVSLKSKLLCKDPLPKISRYDAEVCKFLRTHTSPIRKFLEHFQCWVGISRNYTLDENSYPTFWDGEEEMDLFAFIHHSDPTEVRIEERNLADCEVKLKRRYQEHSVGKDDDVLEEVGAEKAKNKRKRKMSEGVSGSVYPPKKLRDDHQSLPPLTGGKSFSALRGMVPEGSATPSDVAEPLITASVTPMPDVGPVDSVSGLNLRTRPAPVRYVVSLDDSHYSGSYFKTASLVRSIADVLSLDTEIVHRVYVPRWKVTDESVLDDPYVCLGAEVRMRAGHTLEKKSELEDRCAEQATLLSEKDAKIVHLRMRAEHTLEKKSELEDRYAVKGTELRDVKEKNFALEGEKDNFALEGEKDVLSARVEALESVVASKEVASLEAERDCLATQVSIEYAFELFKEQVGKMQDEQVGVLSDRVTTIDSDLMEMVLHMEAEFYPRYLTTIAGRRWILSH